MTLLLKQLFQLFRLLNSENDTRQISLGVAAGFILGMTPVLSLQSVLVFVFLFVFRVQIGAALVTAFFFKFVAYLLDPVFHEVGRLVLETQALQGLWTTLFNLPIVPYTRFYNSIVMGSGVVTIVLSPLVFILAERLVAKYRVTVVARFKNTKFWKGLQATKFYNWYVKYDELYG